MNNDISYDVTYLSEIAREYIRTCIIYIPDSSKHENFKANSAAFSLFMKGVKTLTMRSKVQIPLPALISRVLANTKKADESKNPPKPGLENANFNNRHS